MALSHGWLPGFSINNMKTSCSTSICTALVAAAALFANTASSSEVALTIYNQNFAVVRDSIPLDLQRGTNQVRYAGVTAWLEPSSVVLRDPAGKHQFQVLEQNYRGDPATPEMLLAFNEGKTIEFEITSERGGQTLRELVPGKIIRAGSSQTYSPYSGYQGQVSQPIIEINGKLRFGLPGQPIFSALADNSILKPTLQWVVASDAPARFDAEISYVTSEMRWQADYNLVLPEKGNTLDIVGWVTMENDSGSSFENARIKLMAGDVNKIQPQNAARRGYAYGGMGGGGGGAPPVVTEKSFDEYHLYNLERPATLLDKEKKQVEFVHAADVRSDLIYVYDGVKTDNDRAWDPEALHTEPSYGTASNKKVWVVREFTNSAPNHLGLPLPKGRLRIYRRDTGGQLEFTGENVIDHTPRDELVRLITGNAFDLVGERKRTNIVVNIDGAGANRAVAGIDPATGLPVWVPAPRSASGPPPPWIDESFEIALRNHKREPVEIRVVEHLYRWVTWEIKESSTRYRKTDGQTIEFPVQLKPDEERTISYTVHYWW